MSTYTAIDLSQLPAPTIVESLDFESILATMLADLQAREPTFTALVESDPAYKILEVCAYRELLIRQRVNDAARGVMLAYATGADLDQIGALFNVKRLTSVLYQNTITVSGALVPDVTGIFKQESIDVFGHPIYTTDGKKFPSSDGVWAYCYYDSGWRIAVYIDQSLTSYQWLSEPFPLAIHATPDLADWSQSVFYGGAAGIPSVTLQEADPITISETDADFRRRIQLSLEGFSVAGPEGAYVFWALTASAAVLDASATSPTPGTVIISVLSRIGSGEAGYGLLSDVDFVLNSDSIRPLTDEVLVQSAEIVNLEVEALIHVYPGPDSSLILEAAEAALSVYLDSVHRLGKDVSISGIYAALHRPGVQRVTLISPTADIPITPLQASFCSGKNITLAGTDD